MREIIVSTFLSPDGVMQAPGGPNEDHEGGFQHGGWLVPYFDEKLVEIMTEWTIRVGAFLLGRKIKTQPGTGPEGPISPFRPPRARESHNSAGALFSRR